MEFGKFTLMKLMDGKDELAPFFMKDKWYEDPWLLGQIMERVIENNESASSPAILLPYFMFLAGEGARFRDLLRTWPMNLRWALLLGEHAPRFMKTEGYGDSVRIEKEIPQSDEFKAYLTTLYQDLFDDDPNLKGYSDPETLVFLEDGFSASDVGIMQATGLVPIFMNGENLYLAGKHNQLGAMEANRSPGLSKEEALDVFKKIQRVNGYLEFTDRSYYSNMTKKLGEKLGTMVARIPATDPTLQKVLNIPRMAEKGSNELLRRFMDFNTEPKFEVWMNPKAKTNIKLLLRGSFQRSDWRSSSDDMKKLRAELPDIMKKYGYTVMDHSDSDWNDSLIIVLGAKSVDINTKKRLALFGKTEE